MAGRQLLTRSLHDVGLAAWFGGSLMGAVGLNGAAAAVRDPGDRTRVAAAGWAKWAPVQGVALAAHLVGDVALLVRNSGRVATQQGAGANTAVKTALTAAALGITVWSGIEGARLGKETPTPAAGATEPTGGTDEHTASAQRRLKVLQWSIPALTGVLLVLTSQQGEQQKPRQIAAGVVKNLLP